MKNLTIPENIRENSGHLSRSVGSDANIFKLHAPACENPHRPPTAQTRTVYLEILLRIVRESVRVHVRVRVHAIQRSRLVGRNKRGITARCCCPRTRGAHVFANETRWRTRVRHTKVSYTPQQITVSYYPQLHSHVPYTHNPYTRHALSHTHTRTHESRYTSETCI